jgi:hypothetical protein
VHEGIKTFVHFLLNKKPPCGEVGKLRSFIMTTKTNNNTIYAGGKVIGQVRGDTFYKTIKNKHMLKVPPAIANNISALEDAMRAGANNVCITNKDSGIAYTASMERIFKKGVKFNRGFGEQVFLPLGEWQKSGANVARQFELFGGLA